jgi:hypothetical protein
VPIGAIAGVTAVAGIGSAVIGAGAQKSAANQASATAAANSAANNALSREQYAKNEGHLAPWENYGRAAGDELTGLLLGPAPGGTWGTTPASGTPPASAGTDGINGYFGPSMAEISAMQSDGIPGNYRSSLAAYNTAQRGARNTPPTPAPPPAPVAPGGNAAQSAFDRFRNSTNYQFRLGEGEKAVNTGYAAKGAIESGAAMKGINDYAQNTASNELSNYMDQLYRQEQLGMGASSAIAGVGQTMVGQVTANNNAASNAASNAQLASGNATAGMWNNIGSTIGQVGGMIAGGMGSPGGSQTFNVPQWSPQNIAASMSSGRFW